MKREIIILLVITLVAYSLFAQDTFIYRMGGEKMYLQEDSVSIVISFKTLEYTSDSIGIATTEATKLTFQLS